MELKTVMRAGPMTYRLVFADFGPGQTDEWRCDPGNRIVMSDPNSKGCRETRKQRIVHDHFDKHLLVDGSR